ncbi:MAG TPA: hypothetical protein ENO20_03380 [Bacteroides sp.]|nr:hypothetical protein [Bacteroides sp.]
MELIFLEACFEEPFDDADNHRVIVIFISMKRINTKSPWFFFYMTYGISWLFWIPATFVEENVLETSWVILLYLGGLGPPVAGIALTYLNKDKVYQKEYWQRVFNPKRTGGKWY